MSRSFRYAVAAAMTVALTGHVALAQEASVPVGYGDLDISKPADAAKLLRRIEVAAQQMCEEITPHWTIKRFEEVNCRTQAVRRTVESASIPALSLAWSGKVQSAQMASR